MKATFKSAIAAVLLLSMSSAMAVEFSGNVAMSNDYRFRGISQTNEEPAISGGFDIAADNGLYFGTWASNVDFGDGDGTASEIDFYAGYAGEINEDLGFDVGVIYYYYPSDNQNPDYDYVEFAASLSYMDGSIGVIYSNDFFAETGNYWYVSGDYSIGLPEDFSLDLHVGVNFFDSKGEFVAGGDTEDQYIDWSIGISKSALGLDFSLAYVDTDLDDKFLGDISEGTAVFTVGRSF